MYPSNKRLLGIVTITSLTLTAFTGFWWQWTKYSKANHRWETINKQLSKDTPTDLASNPSELYPFKYVSVKGLLSKKYVLVSRGKDSRQGDLVFRAADVGADQLIVLNGWMPRNVAVPDISEDQNMQHKGLLKPGQNKDYLNRKMNLNDQHKGEEFNTYINLDRILQQLGVKKTPLNSKYYIQLFVDKEKKMYPVRYTKNDFQKPYLTPERHLNYAIFWGSTTLVGIWGITKAFKR